MRAMRGSSLSLRQVASYCCNVALLPNLSPSFPPSFSHAYHAVPECNPRIEELDMLVERLNSNESLSDFTLAVRKAWAARCRES
jgi:hypothetical protein